MLTQHILKLGYAAADAQVLVNLRHMSPASAPEKQPERAHRRIRNLARLRHTGPSFFQATRCILQVLI
jgi:hypothetical protein